MEHPFYKPARALGVYERLGFEVEKRSTVVRKPLVTEPTPVA